MTFPKDQVFVLLSFLLLHYQLLASDSQPEPEPLPTVIEDFQTPELSIQSGTPVVLKDFPKALKELNGKIGRIVCEEFGKYHIQIKDIGFLAVERDFFRIHHSKSNPKRARIPKTSKFPLLDPKGLDLEILAQKSYGKLQKILRLETENGRIPTAVLMGNELSSSLKLITRKNKLFKSFGIKSLSLIEDLEVFKEKMNSFSSTGEKIEKIICFIKPEQKNLRSLELLANIYAQGKDWEITVYFTPSITLKARQYLTKTRTYSKVKIKKLPIYLFPMDNDLVSMELNNPLFDLAFHNDPSSLSFVAQALLKLQKNYGMIDFIKAKGELSHNIVQMLIEEEQALKGESRIPPAPRRRGRPNYELILIDRSTDWVTPFTSPLTYEALIDEFYGLFSGRTAIKETLEDEDEEKEDPLLQEGNEKKSYYFNNTDPLHMHLRGMSIETLGDFLRQYALEVQKLEEKKPHKRSSVKYVHHFTRNILPNFLHKSNLLKTHLKFIQPIQAITNEDDFREKWQLERNIHSEENRIRDIIDHYIEARKPLKEVIRLIALQSLCLDGLKDSEIRNIRTALSGHYEEDTEILMNKIEELGIIKLKKRGVKPFGIHRIKKIPEWEWRGVRKRLDLLTHDGDRQDISYVTAGYAPITGRLLEEVLRNKDAWSSRFMKDLPGPDTEYILNQDVHEEKRKKTKLDPIIRREKKKIIFFFVVGGLSYMELAVLRRIQEKTDHRIIALTTSMINGNKVFDELKNF